MRQLVLLLLILGVTSSLIPPFFRGRPRGGFIDHGAKHIYREKYGKDMSNADISPSLINFKFDQPLVHGSTNETRTFQQKAWYDPKFVPSSGSNIAFLMIQGESMATDLWAGYDGYQYRKMAALHNAHVFQLEHRCFGHSRPLNNLEVDTLEFCHIDDALEDIASFITGMNQRYNISDPRWITFGGSYPGILSALFRQKHPELTRGAVASSAPLKFTIDAWDYALSMEETFKTIPYCAEAIKTAFGVLQQYTLTKSGRTKLNSQLHLSPGFDDSTTQNDIDNFFANVFASYQDIVQYTFDGRNNDTKSTRNINTLCSYMTTTEDFVDRVWKVIAMANGFGPSDSFPNSYSAMIKVLQNTTFDEQHPYLDDASNRGWLWLQCQQMGVQQTTDQGRNIFGQILPINYFLKTCSDGFQKNGTTYLSARTQYDRTKKSQIMYGNGDYDMKNGVSNVVLPNGSFDPWSKLGWYKDVPERNIKTIFIQGTAHCADMYEDYPGEPVGLKAARKEIYALVDKFLQ